MLKKENLEIIIRMFTSSISIIAGMVSFLFVLTQLLKLNVKFSFFLLGLFSSVMGVILSIIISYLIKKKATAKVFISYSIKDKEFVDKLVNDLNKNSIQSFLEEEIQVGDNWRELFSKKIKDTNLVIPIISNSFLASDHNTMELKYAMKNGKIILPVLREKINLPSNLKYIKYSDFTEKENYDKEIEQLVKSILQKYKPESITSGLTRTRAHGA